MASNNRKYSEEMGERTARHIIENKKSTTSISDELGIDTNTVCSGKSLRKHGLPSYVEQKGLKRAEPKSNNQLILKVKELEKEPETKERKLQMAYQKRKQKAEVFHLQPLFLDLLI